MTRFSLAARTIVPSFGAALYTMLAATSPPAPVRLSTITLGLPGRYLPR